MSIRLPIIAATLMVTTVSLGTVFNASPASARDTITCESRGNDRNTCEVGRGSRVRFVRQLSDASCRGNWGYRRNRIWVRNGCRAEFAVSDAAKQRLRERQDDRYDRNDRYNDGYGGNDRYNDGYGGYGGNDRYNNGGYRR
ncbi:DUF3011 domain-containing protein [Brasilonema octagenarum]|uniref:DUF3011 domain-containing protein n=1 Tax=Brasilonema octagenarum UFV-OR1 TaxID=417115 RepID=A0ABX1M2M6_9CYAN|nr:DUF3011 domain-containing protein [Brasilonema octagenarum]NMF61436.1 hypothetical protein [Brasilonema octagenarum UFV-OR1]